MSSFRNPICGLGEDAMEKLPAECFQDISGAVFAVWIGSLTTLVGVFWLVGAIP